ncbi:uncharacterized protein A1O9_12809 [Exophiala aquamarina CBS 119918]|uniref:Cupin type-1 domain-containing protein n=1 Tax=Exophiala aquamarina CBS 119918 TaxID=1182545 RepID=A0A072P6F2_9EURO|nr:uncharacterized protein A1O9_12809 [Exophiala aquamarina CBS 119918]KEF51195.1 hypothetical protein A1O9_12809 [Exophiala aquamarina CBS 119918]
MRLSTWKAFTTLNIFASLPLATSKITHNAQPLSQQQPPADLRDGESLPSTSLLVTAVLNSPSPPHHAIIECWAFSTPFKTYPTVGKALTLGDTRNATYVVLPPQSAEGWHRPPANMYFILLSGAAHVHAPSPSTGIGENMQHAHEHLYIKPGQNQLIIAVDGDRSAPGHLTYYPGDTETVALQVPFRGGIVPDHSVVKAGACEGPTDEVIEPW